MSDVVLQTEELYYRYPTREQYAIRDVNFAVREGEFVALIGQNGSGKTTLIKHFNGLLRPTRGRVLVDGRDTSGVPTSELAKKVGFVFQNPDHQIFAETVREEIAFGPRNLGFDEAHIKRRTEEVLAEVGLSGYLEEMPSMLGRGQRQRVAVAAVLAMEPPILIIDEPTTGQDWKECTTLMELVKRLNEKGHTILMTTHNMRLVSLYARRVVVMRQGEIWLDSSTQEVFQQVEPLLEAAIKPPVVYQLAAGLHLDMDLGHLVTSDDLAALLAKKVGAAAVH